jgi:hypothetical protein
MANVVRTVAALRRMATSVVAAANVLNQATIHCARVLVTGNGTSFTSGKTNYAVMNVQKSFFIAGGRRAKQKSGRSRSLLPDNLRGAFRLAACRRVFAGPPATLARRLTGRALHPNLRRSRRRHRVAPRPARKNRDRVTPP